MEYSKNEGPSYGILYRTRNYTSCTIEPDRSSDEFGPDVEGGEVEEIEIFDEDHEMDFANSSIYLSSLEVGPPQIWAYTVTSEQRAPIGLWPYVDCWWRRHFGTCTCVVDFAWGGAYERAPTGHLKKKKNFKFFFLSNSDKYPVLFRFRAFLGFLTSQQMPHFMPHFEAHEAHTLSEAQSEAHKSLKSDWLLTTSLWNMRMRQNLGKGWGIWTGTDGSNFSKFHKNRQFLEYMRYLTSEVPEVPEVFFFFLSTEQ